jgi:hypothetical protein
LEKNERYLDPKLILQKLNQLWKFICSLKPYK